MSEEVRTKPPSSVQATPTITIGQDGKWIQEIQGETLRFREATFDERSVAENVGATVAPNAPVNPMLGLSNEQLAQLLGLIVERRNKNGVWEPLTRALIGKRKDSFFFMTLGYYLGGLAKIAEDTRNLSQPTSEATPKTPESDASSKP